MLDRFEVEDQAEVDAALAAANKRPEAKTALTNLLRRLGG